MNPSRRSFLRTGSMIGLATLVSGRLSSIVFGQKPSQDLGSGLGFVIPKEALNDPLYKITRAMFTENLRTKFTFHLGEVRLTEMTLIEVNNFNPPFAKIDGTSSRDCFSIVFRGPRGLPLRQGTYTLEHSSLGTFQLLVVPGQTDRLGIRYGAIINRLYP
jgi:hypothetical protein